MVLSVAGFEIYLVKYASHQKVFKSRQKDSQIVTGQQTLSGRTPLPARPASRPAGSASMPASYAGLAGLGRTQGRQLRAACQPRCGAWPGWRLASLRVKDSTPALGPASKPARLASLHKWRKPFKRLVSGEGYKYPFSYLGKWTRTRTRTPPLLQSSKLIDLPL